jgi:hypothetical protein
VSSEVGFNENWFSKIAMSISILWVDVMSTGAMRIIAVRMSIFFSGWMECVLLH